MRRDAHCLIYCNLLQLSRKQYKNKKSSSESGKCKVQELILIPMYFTIALSDSERREESFKEAERLMIFKPLALKVWGSICAKKVLTTLYKTIYYCCFCFISVVLSVVQLHLPPCCAFSSVSCFIL